MVPVLFKCAAGSDPAQALGHVQQQMRGIPNNGIGYGLMRYVSADKEISSRMRSLPNPQVSFNYFGKMDQMFAGQSLFQPAPETKGATESPRAQRPHLIDLNGMIQSKSLRVLFGYNEAIHRTETITRLADLIWNALRSYLNDQRTPDNAYTPVDFPMAALSQKELNRLVHEIQIGDD
jgi:non-ribosomal peptide synthase protein (TIGR01720 family)